MLVSRRSSVNHCSPRNPPPWRIPDRSETRMYGRPINKGDAAMEIGTLHVVATVEPVAELDRLGDEIVELAAHLDAATARLLELIREFDARGGWNHGFRSCAQWLSWRVGMKLGAGREQVRVARAVG